MQVPLERIGWMQRVLNLVVKHRGAKVRFERLELKQRGSLGR